MTNSNQNEPVGTPVADPKANWGWLQERVSDSQVSVLHDWIEEQLSELEEAYAGLITSQSLKLSLRSELREGR